MRDSFPMSCSPRLMQSQVTGAQNSQGKVTGQIPAPISPRCNNAPFYSAIPICLPTDTAFLITQESRSTYSHLLRPQPQSLKREKPQSSEILNILFIIPKKRNQWFQRSI